MQICNLLQLLQPQEPALASHRGASGIPALKQDGIYRSARGNSIMRKTTTVCSLAAFSLVISGCSTKPRNFTAALAAPVTSRTSFESEYRTCQNLVASGRTKDFKAGAAQVLAAGAGAIGGGIAIAGLGIGGTLSGAGMAAAAAMPVVGVLAGFGVARAIRGGRERKFKRLMSNCLSEYGYNVASWSKLHKREDAAQFAANAALIEAPKVVAPETGPSTTANATPPLETAR